MNSAPLLVTLLTAPSSPEPQLIDLDGTFFIQLGVLFVLMLALTRLLWKPYLRVRAERVSRVEGYREEAARLEADAQQRLERAEGALAEARRVGAGERAVARAEAHAREQTLLAEARARVAATVATERAKLDASAAATAREAARKILGREVAA
jgi:F0F1-type ATP synthase membrane subunit b/b'